MKRCKKCNRPVLKYKGDPLFKPISNVKHCIGKCTSKNSVLPPPAARPIKLQN